VLKSVPGLDTRPTPDRLRETLFDILSTRIEGVVFADLYAGTGSVGIEALSRGAKRAIFVESNRAAATVIRENLRSLGIESSAQVWQGKVGAVEADIAFIDPPYHLEKLYGVALDAVRAALVVVQHDKRLKLAAEYGALRHTRTVKQGDNCLSFFETIRSAGA
jgi:16S rRNA (guanine(966)-N(2))-methyltransferase RsmD